MKPLGVVLLLLGFNIFNILAQQLRLGNINNLLKGFSSPQKKGFRKNYVYASLLLRTKVTEIETTVIPYFSKLHSQLCAPGVEAPAGPPPPWILDGRDRKERKRVKNEKKERKEKNNEKKEKTVK